MRVVGVCGLLGLWTVGAMSSASAASPKLPSVQSRDTRLALLSLFDQSGASVDFGDDPTRSRANRRHPDVGFTSRDPICLSCVMTVLAPPVLPPPQPTISSLPLLPPPAPTPVPPLPVAPNPPAILQSGLPAVLPSAEIPIWNPLETPTAPSLIELPPIGFAMEAIPDASVPVISSSQVPLQTPGPLPILGPGMAFALTRRLRGRIKAGRS